MAYTKIVYQNSPSTATPLNAENLNHMDDQIALNDQRLTEIETSYVKSFNGRKGEVTPQSGDYNIGQITPLTGAQVGQVPVVVNHGTEEDPELVFEMGAGGGGGHSIIDSEGNTMPQEDAMQFADSFVSDDDANGKTVVENIKEVDPADYDSTTDEGIIVCDDGNDVPIGEIEEDYEEVIADGDTTYEDLFILLHSKIDASKVTKEAKLVRGTDDLFIFHMGINYLNKTAPNNYADFFSLDATGGRTQDCDIIRLGSSPAYYTLNGGTGAGTNHLTQKPSDGSVWRFYYGTSSGIVELNTGVSYSTAERKIGKWIDGSDLYEKTVNIGALPNATSKQVNHGINNLGTIVEIKGIAIRSSDNASKPLPFSDPTATKIISLEATTSIIYTETGTNYSAYNAWVTLRYTKS